MWRYEKYVKLIASDTISSTYLIIINYNIILRSEFKFKLSSQTHL